MEKQHLNLYLNEQTCSPKLTLTGSSDTSADQTCTKPLHLHKEDDSKQDFFSQDSKFGECVRSGLVVIDVSSEKRSGDELTAHLNADQTPQPDIPTTREEIAQLKRAYECRGAGYLVAPTIGFGALGDMLTRLWLESRGQSTDPPSAA